MTQSSKLILGPPGTGKTTRLLDIMSTEFSSGCAPNKMVYCSFTKKAVEEAVERAVDRFNFTKQDMVYFKTLHSLAYHALGLKKSNVMQMKDYKKIGAHLGLLFSTSYDLLSDTSFRTRYNGDQYQFIHGFHKARRIPERDVWDLINHDNLNWYEYKRYVDTMQQYKQMHNLVDFNDMLELPESAIDVDVVIIDEAQDLSTLQWHFIRQFTRNAKRVYIGGDDDQAIYGWSGADVDEFLQISGEREILHTSYRIPRAVHTLATQLTSKIKHRVKKEYTPQSREGAVEYWTNADHIDMTSGSWLLLARNSYLLAELAASVKRRGLSYAMKGHSAIAQSHVRAIQKWEKWRQGAILDEADIELIQDFLPRGCTVWPRDKMWHEAMLRMPLEDREYYISMLRRGESITKNPRININTIHGVKGGEADHVAILTDMAASTWEASAQDADSEHRVWYVGATRCRESLNIIMPRGKYYYDL